MACSRRQSRLFHTWLAALAIYRSNQLQSIGKPCWLTRIKPQGPCPWSMCLSQHLTCPWNICA